jgi:large subunit ribosomal protein L13
MKPKLQKTYSPKPDDIDRAWLLIDASGIPLGRLASEVAKLLRGKHKPIYAPHVDAGDFVIVVNAADVAATGAKGEQKMYRRHSGYPGGLRAQSLDHVRRTHPERIVETAVKGMLPKGPLGRKMFRKLKVYGGPEHPHAAQQPRPFELDIRKVES